MRIILLILLMISSTAACSPDERPVLTGAEQMGEYLPILEGKRIAIVSNHTSVIDDQHLVDTLLKSGIELVRIMKVFVPEHGFRGDFDAGATVSDERDPLTGIPLVSLYGRHKKPFPEDMEDVDLVIFDIQDVGVRFYTYISTLHYVMEACAESEVPLLVLDRPNPNSGYVDGPILKQKHASFIGMHPIPVVYGLTIGELALMINGEGWLKNHVQCELEVIPCKNFYHGKFYALPVNPSPNLSNDHAIRIYPSTCFFEGTVVSEGRGTDSPFEVFGHPLMKGAYSFTPVSMPGKSTYPKLQDQLCFGVDLRDFEPEEGWNKIFLNWLIETYEQFPDKDDFFTPFFEKLAGTESLREQIVAGWSEDAIRKSWEEDLDIYRSAREKYLLYP